MKNLILYRRNSGVSNRYAEFPRDFHAVGVSLIDDEVAGHPLISERRWSMQVPTKAKSSYALTYVPNGGRHKAVLLHRVVWEIWNGEIPDGLEIDHIDRDGLNNQIANLRLATRGQNTLNREKHRGCQSIFKGVYVGNDQRRKANVEAFTSLEGGKKLALGRYLTEYEAAYAFNVAAIAQHGDLAVLNEIPADAVSPERQLEIRLKVEQKLRSRGLIPLLAS